MCMHCTCVMPYNASLVLLFPDIPKCKKLGDSCGIFKKRVCAKCGNKLCCRKGVTKGGSMK